VNAAKVVKCEPEGIGSFQIFPFLAECICQTRHAPHTHPNAQILPFDVRGADAVCDRPSHDLDWD
jgi:hypothetical protein